MSVHISVTASRTIGTTIRTDSHPDSATIGRSDSPIVTIVLTLVTIVLLNDDDDDYDDDHCRNN